MIEINLLPLEFRRKESAQFKLPELPYLRFGAVILAVLLGGEALLFAGLLWMKSGSRALETQIKELGPDFERIKGLRLETMRKEADAAALDKMMGRPVHWTFLMNAISDSLVDSLWLSEVSVERKMFEFEIKPPPKPKAKKGAKPAKGEEPEPPAKKPTRVRGPQIGKRYEYYLVIEGRAPIASNTTAAVGKYIQILEENPVLRETVESVKLEKIDRQEVKDGSMQYVFTIRSKMKPAYGEDHADTAS